MEHVADVDIEADGVFKYILIKLSDKKGTGGFKVVVRGYSWADYHGELQFHTNPVKESRLPHVLGKRISLVLAVSSAA